MPLNYHHYMYPIGRTMVFTVSLVFQERACLKPVSVTQAVNLKVPGPISQNIGDFYSIDASSPKKSWFQISGKLVKPFGYKKRLRILQLPIPYCVRLLWLP